MANRKANKAKRHRGGNLSQLGLMDVPNLDGLTLGEEMDGDNDSDLEAELLALTGGGGAPRRGQPKKVASPEELAVMVADCMRDDIGEDDDDFNENDPDLLAELSALSSGGDDREWAPSGHPSSPMYDYRNPEPRAPRQAPMAGGSNLLDMLTERISLYQEAEANAKADGDSSRARRLNRGLKTLTQMQKQVKAGKSINEEDIPGAVVVRRGGGGGSGESSATSSTSSPAVLSPSEDTAPPPVPPHTGPPPATITQNVVFREQDTPRSDLPPRLPSDSQPSSQSRGPVDKPPPRPVSSQTSSSDAAVTVHNLHNQYKLAALMAKKQGDRDQAIAYMRIMKQMEPMLKAAESGQPVDLSSLPGPPGSVMPQDNVPKPVVAAEPVPVASVTPDPGSSNGEVGPAPGAPPVPATVLEALLQRLDKYQQQLDKAKKEENSRKQRMNQRIIKQYEDAIKKHKAGKPVDFSELPSPPGYAPIPVGGGGEGGGGGATHAGSGDSSGPSPTKQPRTAPAQPAPTARPAPPPPKQNVRQAPQSIVEKQLALLTRRQGQFKQAALEAKKRGEVEQAKEYLRMSKGFDNLIQATRSGLPVDMNTVPIPPQEKTAQAPVDLAFEMVDKEDCVTAPDSTPADMAVTYAKLEEDLIAQIKMCAQTREHFKATGDVASANRFEQLILHTKKDLDAVRAAFKGGSTPPRFHYENRSFNIIQCNTDLNDSDCEATVLRGVNFNVQNPGEVDTYLKIEFPYPSDNPPQDRSVVIKDTNNPEYNHKTVFSIDRKSRALARCFKRHSLKIQVYTKGGWFHRDALLGVVKVPLVTLETKCTLHESFDLTDERKRMVGGKLEVKVRVRNPIVAKQLEKVTEKWLVIDGF